MNIVKLWHERSERLKREKGNTGHIYLEFGPDGDLRTFNNESDRDISIASNGDITIERRQDIIQTGKYQIEYLNQPTPQTTIE